jgi:[protein-PII] uridylyltransferase
VDEHTLRAVGVIADIAAGLLNEDHPLAVSVMPLIADREALFLAMLLHDTGKGGVDGQEIAGARAAKTACARLGLEPERVEMVSWLVGHHLVMSDFAQKRDVNDPATVAAFAKVVENPERLRLLLVLTVADIRAVGPGVWNGWKGQLMRELYGATEAIFRGGRGSDPAAHFRLHQTGAAEAARERLFDSAPPGDPGLRVWAGGMEDAYFTAFTPEEQAIHYALTGQAAESGGAAASAKIDAERNAAEIAIAAGDRRGLFADLAGAIAGFGANVVGAKVYTSTAGQALDVFYVQDATGAPFGYQSPLGLERLCRALEAAARGETPVFEARRNPELGRASAFTVAPAIAVDNEASDAATVVEVSGRDRPGLLEAVTRTLADAGVSIQSAHVDNYGERAVDAFYCHGPTGGKLTDPRRIAALRAALVDILDDSADLNVGRPKLRRARASVAR